MKITAQSQPLKNNATLKRETIFEYTSGQDELRAQSASGVIGRTEFGIRNVNGAPKFVICRGLH